MKTEQSERARVDAAIRQRYQICHAHYPPVVMTSKDDRNWTCPKCGNTKYTGVSAVTQPVGQPVGKIC